MSSVPLAGTSTSRVKVVTSSPLSVETRTLASTFTATGFGFSAWMVNVGLEEEYIHSLPGTGTERLRSTSSMGWGSGSSAGPSAGFPHPTMMAVEKKTAISIEYKLLMG